MFSNLLIYQPLRRVGWPEETEEGEPLALNRCEGKGARRGGGVCLMPFTLWSPKAVDGLDGFWGWAHAFEGTAEPQRAST